jgi:3-oxoacyl-[acyl-carrier-protein] synthase II
MSSERPGPAPSRAILGLFRFLPGTQQRSEFPMRKVVITGLGVVSPVGSKVQEFWRNLTSGVSGLGRITRFDPTNFDAQIAGEVKDLNLDEFIPRKEQRRMDPFSHFALSAAKMAVVDSGIDMGAGDPTRRGCIVGSGVGGISTIELQDDVIKAKGPGRVSPFTIPQMIANMASGLIGIEHNLQGPNYAVISACATGAHSIGDAARIIERGDADLMLAGGTEAPITPLSVAGFASMKALCATHNDDPKTGSRPFDATRDGFVMGEGAAIVVLEEYESARRRGATIYCEVAGFGMTCDAYHMTAPSSDGAGATRAILAALKDAGATPDQVDYINAHGTSTPLNDKIESLAIKTALGESARKVMVSSTKSMTGHLLGAAGGIETAVCALAIRHGVVPPTINLVNPDPECDLDYVPNTAREADVRLCLNNSLGFGGHNACLALRKIG